MITLKHQVIYKGKNGDMLLVEQCADWNIPKSELGNAMNQLSIMRWEEELIMKHVVSKRQVMSKEEALQWEKETKEAE